MEFLHNGFLLYGGFSNAHTEVGYETVYMVLALLALVFVGGCICIPLPVPNSVVGWAE